MSTWLKLRKLDKESGLDRAIDDLRRDEPPTQKDLDDRARRAGCPGCGSRSIASWGSTFHCNRCQHEWKREVA